MTTSRREFLEEATAFVVLTGAAAVAWEHVAAGTPERSPNYKMSDHWWAMTIDIDKCIGCGSCVKADKAENKVPEEYYRTWIERYHVSPTEQDHPHVDSPEGGAHGFAEIYRAEGVTKSFFVPKLCNHCKDSPCVQVCPVGATFDSPDGVVLVDTQYCLGCRYCVQACPYGCRYINPETNTVDKCSLCYHRITKGLKTACVEVCPTHARLLGDLKNPSDPIHEFLRTHKVQVLKPQMATHPKIFYANLDGSVR